MKKTALIVLSLLIIMVNNPAMGMDPTTEVKLEEDSPVSHQTWPQPNVLPSEEYERKLSVDINTLRNFIKTAPSQKTVGSFDVKDVASKFENNIHMKLLLQKIPAEYFYWFAQKLVMPHNKGQFTEDFITKYTNACAILAEAKIELKLEEADLKDLAKKYNFHEGRFSSNAINILAGFARHFEIAPPLPASKRATCFWCG